MRKELAAIVSLVSNLAALRASEFELIEALEEELGHGVNVSALETAIDCDAAGREEVTEREALVILRAATSLRAVA